MYETTRAVYIQVFTLVACGYAFKRDWRVSLAVNYTRINIYIYIPTWNISHILSSYPTYIQIYLCAYISCQKRIFWITDTILLPLSYSYYDYIGGRGNSRNPFHCNLFINDTQPLVILHYSYIDRVIFNAIKETRKCVFEFVQLCSWLIIFVNQFCTVNKVNHIKFAI